MGRKVLSGSYELLERIAEGGMAELWKARSRGVAGFEKTVAIKRVLPGLMARPGFAELLIREAKIASRLTHPNIVQIFDLGEEDDGYFIVMEFVHGRDLSAAMALGSSRKTPEGDDPLSVPLQIWTIAEAAKALHHAHTRKDEDGQPLSIVHRDISPQNILLGFEGEVKVGDFGIARADAEGLGRGEDPKVLRGKFAYMSPEQADGQPLDRRSDIFSLGIVFHELLSGERLFRANDAKETLDRVRRAPIPSLDVDALGMPQDLARIVDRALSRSPEDRFETAGELCDALSELLFSLGANVRAADLAVAMRQMFPDRSAENPNKVRIDVLLRAYHDATAASRPFDEVPERDDRPIETEVRTAPGIAARRERATLEPVAVLCVDERAGEEQLFGDVIRAAIGVPLPSRGGKRFAVFVEGATAEAAGVRAARAALEFRRRVDLEGLARAERVAPIGIAPGEAEISENHIIEPTGASFDRCLEIQASGESRQIRIAPSLRDEIARALDVRGGPTPEACSVEGYRAVADQDTGHQRARGPLIGRRSAMSQLAQHLVGAFEGRSRALVMLGAPGMGRTRLLAEFSNTLGMQDILVIGGRAPSQTANPSSIAFSLLVRDLSGLSDEDTPAERHAKIDRLRVLGISAREVRTLGRLIGLSYPVAGDERAGRPRGLEVVLALRKALRKLAEDRVIVVAIEDLHFADDQTRQLLPLFVHGLALSRVLPVITSRVGSALPLLHADVLLLEPLERPAAAALLTARLNARSLDPDLEQFGWSATAGNPRDIEWLAAELRAHVDIEEGVAHLRRTLNEAPLPLDVAEEHMRTDLAAQRPVDRKLLSVLAMFARGADRRALAELMPDETVDVPLRRLLLRELAVPAERSLCQFGLPWQGRWGTEVAQAPLPHRVRIRGELSRRALHALLREDERRRLMRSALAVLERQEGLNVVDLENIVDLHLGTGKAGDALRTARAAAEEAERSGDRAAAVRLQAIVARLEVSPPA